MAFFNKPEAPDYEEGKLDYKAWELEAMADELLQEDKNRELCRECLAEDPEGTPYGKETGEVKSEPVIDNKTKEQLTDDEGQLVFADFPKYACGEGHTWYLGEGKARGIDGENPILFADHLATRRKREIYTTVGTPDPNIVQGIYNRVHPQGRKVNSDAQRKKNGASFTASWLCNELVPSDLQVAGGTVESDRLLRLKRYEAMRNMREDKTSQRIRVA